MCVWVLGLAGSFKHSGEEALRGLLLPAVLDVLLHCVFPWASNWVVFEKLHEVSFELHESQKDRAKRSGFQEAVDSLQS